MHYLFFGTSKIFTGQVHYGDLLVPGQVYNFAISTPLHKLTLTYLPIHLLHHIYQWGKIFCFVFLRAKFRNQSMLFDKTLIKDLLEPDLDIMHDSLKCFLSYYFVSGSDITPCIKIDKPLVAYRFWYCYVLTAVIMSRMYVQNLRVFTHKNEISQ